MDKTLPPTNLGGIAWHGRTTPHGRRAMSSLYDRAADVTRYVYDRRIVGPPVLDLEMNFPGAAKFVGAWREIRDEALRVAADLGRVPRVHEIMPEQAAVSDNHPRHWRMLLPKGQWAKGPRNIRPL